MGPGTEVDHKLEQFADIVYRNDQNLKILHNSPPDSRPVCFTVGLSDIWGGG